jgi:uncharacterized membrane protein
MTLVKSRILLVVLAVSLLFNIGFGVAWLTAQKTDGKPTQETPETSTKKEDGRSGPGALLKSLELSPEQAEAFGKRHKVVAEEVANLRGQVREARDRLWRLVADDALDASALDEQILHISAAQQQVQGIVAQHMVWMRKQLDQSQQQRFDDFVEGKMCRCPGCDGGCLAGCPKQCSKANSAHTKEHSGSECGCGR